MNCPIHLCVHSHSSSDLKACLTSTQVLCFLHHLQNALNRQLVLGSPCILGHIGTEMEKVNGGTFEEED